MANVVHYLSQRALSLCTEFQRLLDNRSAPNDETIDYLKYKLDLMYHHSAYIPRHEQSEKLSKIISNLKQAFHIICKAPEERSFSYQAQHQLTGDPGRPKIFISQSQLEYFLDKGFSCVDIATMLSVSVRTVRRKMSQYDISSSRAFDVISDEDLYKLINEIREKWPRSGYRMVQGCLRARGIRIQQQRVRIAMRSLDPEGTIARWGNTVKRRVYSVRGPNALWHIDGHHKLIR